MPIRRTSNKSSYDSGFYNPELYSDVGSRRIFEFDLNALSYLNAVEAADGQTLEFSVKVAVNEFVVGCKADGIWTAIKASCILAGARTLTGALVPLVGTAPTNFNFWGDADPNWASVSLLLRMNGANASTTFTDSSSNALTATRFGNAQISTAQSKFGGSSGLFDGNGDYLSYAYDAALDLIGSTFTLETWIYPTAYKATGARIVAAGGGAVAFNGTDGIHFLVQLISTGQLYFQSWTGSVSQAQTHPTVVPLSAWSHIAVSVSGSNVYLAVNGVVQTSAVLAPVRPSTNPIFTVATINGEAGSSGTAFVGNIDDLRITKGVARYTANFTPPTQTFPGSTADYNRETGLVGDGSTKYLDSNRNNNAEPQNSKHLSVFCSSASTASAAGRTYIGISSSVAGSSWLHGAGTSNNLSVRANTSTSLFDLPSSSALTGFIGVARDNSSTSDYRYSGTTSSGSAASVSPGSESIKVFLGISASSHSNTRLAFYSIGESLDLALLDTRVSNLMVAISGAIP